MRVANKTRFGAFVVVVLMTVALVFMVVYAANDTPNIVGYHTYVVYDDETLWGIAEALDYPIDTRQIVYDIQQASDLDMEYIHRGDVLQIPIYEED
jgi:hypothetical protein